MPNRTTKDTTTPRAPGRRDRRAALSRDKITARIDASGIGKRITPRSLDQIIHEAHRIEKWRGAGKLPLGLSVDQYLRLARDGHRS